MNRTNKMIGIALIVVGIISFSTGVYLYGKPAKEQLSNPKENLDKIVEMAIADGVLTNNERKLIEDAVNESGANFDEIINKVETRLAESTEKSETAIIDQSKKSGDDFEKFVVKKFDTNFFKVKEWAGDKYVDGVYAETTLQPDLIMEIKVGRKTAELAVECKWRRTLSNGGVTFATNEQLKRYKAFGKERDIPVFVALGLGGEGDNPDELFILPLNEMNDNFISHGALKKYFKNMDKDFYFDIKKKYLS